MKRGRGAVIHARGKARYIIALDDTGKSRAQGKGFIIDDLTDHALKFIEQNQRHPFFCYVPFNTPHSPMQVPERFYGKFANLDLKLRARNPRQEDVAFTRAADLVRSLLEARDARCWRSRGSECS